MCVQVVDSCCATSKRSLLHGRPSLQLPRIDHVALVCLRSPNSILTIFTVHILEVVKQLERMALDSKHDRHVLESWRVSALEIRLTEGLIQNIAYRPPIERHICNPSPSRSIMLSRLSRHLITLEAWRSVAGTSFDFETLSSCRLNFRIVDSVNNVHREILLQNSHTQQPSNAGYPAFSLSLESELSKLPSRSPSSASWRSTAGRGSIIWNCISPQGLETAYSEVTTRILIYPTPVERHIDSL